jgi:competence protein ComEC
MSMRANFINVGHGDSSLVQIYEKGFQNSWHGILVDANSEDAPVDIAKYLKDKGTQNLLHVIITHPHWDHMSGLFDIVDAGIKIHNIWECKYKHDSYESKDYRKLIEKLKKGGTIVYKPTASTNPVNLTSSTKAYFFGPPSTEKDDIHDASIVIKLVHDYEQDGKKGRGSILFGGDAECKQSENGADCAWDRIYKNYKAYLDSSVLHASHHGSINGCHEEAVKSINPYHTIISVGNKHGLPDSKAVKIYEKYTQTKVILTRDQTIDYWLSWGK